MTREKLQEASDELRQAAESTDDEELQQRIHDQSSQLAELAEAEQGPDHGRLARHMNALAEIAEAVDDGQSHVEDAREAVADYRSTVEGV